MAWWPPYWSLWRHKSQKAWNKTKWLTTNFRCERKFKMFPTFPPHFLILLWHVPDSVPHHLSLMIYPLTTQSHFSNEKRCKWRLIVYHVHYVHTVSCHLAMLHTTSYVTSSTSLLVSKTNHVARPTERRSQERGDVVNVEAWLTLWVMLDVACKFNNGHILWRQIAVAMPWCPFSWNLSN
jgi:hypothetical protein